nr:peptidase U32 family protein [Methanothermus fervidus]
MKFSIPLPGTLDSEKEIFKNLPKRDYDVYMAGISEFIGSGRAALYSPFFDDIKEQVNYAHKHGIKFNLVLNSSCFGGKHLTFEGYKILARYIKKLEEIGVDGVIVSDPYLVELVSKETKNIEVCVSCIAHIDSPEKAKFFEKLGASEITLDTNINRHFDIIEAIRDCVNCKLKVIANEACIYKCPFRYFHFNLFSHVTTSPEPIFGDYYFERCISLRVQDPSLIIKSPWIRPEDIKEYKKLGIDSVKIAGRSNTVEWIINTAKSYMKGKYVGNLLDILDCPNELRDRFYIPNDKLDGVIEQWKQCSKFCHDCGFCNELAKEVVKCDVNEVKSVERC